MKALITSILMLILVSLNACKKDTERLSGYSIEGIDVSHHQKDIIWDSLARQNLTFVFMKATEGMTHTDTRFDYNWSEAKRVGLKRGAYHFYSLDSYAKDQARHFIKTVKLEEGDLPPVLDFEHDRFLDNEGLTDSLSIWLTAVEDYFKIKPIIYTNLKLYNTYIKNHFDSYPLWIARYGNEEQPIPVTNMPYIWQYGNRGRLAGIDGHVDFNVFLGSVSEFENLCYMPKENINKKPGDP